MTIRKGCESCPLILDCADFAAEQRRLAESYEARIERERDAPNKVLETIDRLGVILDERVTELTYDYMSEQSPEDAAAIHKENKERDRLDRSFEEITLHGISGARVMLIKELQDAYHKLADASEAYSQELQANCRRGVGRVRSLGLVGTKYLYCRSGDCEPNLKYFTQTPAYQGLIQELGTAHVALVESYLPPPRKLADDSPSDTLDT